MCFERLLNSGLWISRISSWLSINSVGCPRNSHTSPNSRIIQSVSLTAWLVATNSASIVDSNTKLCLWLDHVIAPPNEQWCITSCRASRLCIPREVSIAVNHRAASELYRIQNSLYQFKFFQVLATNLRLLEYPSDSVYCESDVWSRFIWQVEQTANCCLIGHGLLQVITCIFTHTAFHWKIASDVLKRSPYFVSVSALM